jgi:4-amino-4-deoxy-L-arabinose transferase-like glycosyltransferase
MFGFMTAGVNNDVGLYLASAALLLALARLMRRGVSRGRLVAAGLALALGVLVKTQALAFLPAVVLAVLYAWWRGTDRAPRRTAVAALTLVGAIAAPLAVYFVLGHTVWQRPLVDRVSELSGATPKPFELREAVSYGLQLYLPRPPFLTDLFPGDAPYDLWFKGLLGHFGWLDYQYPGWVYPVTLLLTAAVVLLAIRALVGAWPQLRARLPEAIVYVVYAAGLAGAVALAGYRSRVLAGVPFEQGRYLLPLLPLFAGIVALGVRGAGRRFAPALGAAVVMIVLGLDLAAQLLTLGRYYG